MKTQPLARSAWFTLCILLTPQLVAAQQPPNPMHPTFRPLDARGRPAAQTGQPVDDVQTCGECHDATYIRTHNSHTGVATGLACIACHLDQGQLAATPESQDEAGLLRRDALRIGRPRAGNCARCHGVIIPGEEPVVLPPTFPALNLDGAGQLDSLTFAEGAIRAGQPMHRAFLNLQGRSQLTSPWDVHAARLVDCVACHRAQNDPALTERRRSTLRYVKEDPRRLSTAAFLQTPDHRLTTPDCRACHDPGEAHEFLPYRDRHMEVLACQACHIPQVQAPLAQMIDATVVDATGRPVVLFRNVEVGPGETLNTAFIQPYAPPFFQHAAHGERPRLGPVNLVSRWGWIDGQTRQPVPQATVQAVFREGTALAPAVVRALDTDGDGRLGPTELRLATPAQAAAIAALLTSRGVTRPTIEGVIEAYPVVHGVLAPAFAQHACERCHGGGTQLTGDIPLAPYLPGGVAPRPAPRAELLLAGTITPTPDGGLTFHRDAVPTGLHVLGQCRELFSNAIGFWLFVIVFGGIMIHAGLRVWFRRRTSPVAHGGTREYVFSLNERLWHWIMALSGVVLIVTGVQIHLAGRIGLMSLPLAVWLHNVFALLLTVNAFLSLFYHLTTAAIRQFFPSPRGLLASLLRHLDYYGRGIFLGAPHPRSGRKLNPLQQLTYLALLNLLFPLQIVTGLLIWAIGRWPAVADALGGLCIVTPIHNFGAWLLYSFFVLHLYLITTSRTVGSHLVAMITGYETVAAPQPAPPPATGSATEHLP